PPPAHLGRRPAVLRREGFGKSIVLRDIAPLSIEGVSDLMMGFNYPSPSDDVLSYEAASAICMTSQSSAWGRRDWEPLSSEVEGTVKYATPLVLLQNYPGMNNPPLMPYMPSPFFGVSPICSRTDVSTSVVDEYLAYSPCGSQSMLEVSPMTSPPCQSQFSASPDSSLYQLDYSFASSGTRSGSVTCQPQPLLPPPAPLPVRSATHPHDPSRGAVHGFNPAHAPQLDPLRLRTLHKRRRSMNVESLSSVYTHGERNAKRERNYQAKYRKKQDNYCELMMNRLASEEIILKMEVPAAEKVRLLEAERAKFYSYAGSLKAKKHEHFQKRVIALGMEASRQDILGDPR
ncbi:hypothetical protein P7C73_g2308, partial [Tremellales sp. Uapishka_1]